MAAANTVAVYTCLLAPVACINGFNTNLASCHKNIFDADACCVASHKHPNGILAPIFEHDCSKYAAHSCIDSPHSCNNDPDCCKTAPDSCKDDADCNRSVSDSCIAEILACILEADSCILEADSCISFINKPINEPYKQ